MAAAVAAAVVLVAVLVVARRSDDTGGMASAPGTTVWWDDPARGADILCGAITTEDIVLAHPRETALVEGEVGPGLRTVAAEPTPDRMVGYEETVYRFTSTTILAGTLDGDLGREDLQEVTARRSVALGVVLERNRNCFPDVSPLAPGRVVVLTRRSADGGRVPLTPAAVLDVVDPGQPVPEGLRLDVAEPMAMSRQVVTGRQGEQGCRLAWPLSTLVDALSAPPNADTDPSASFEATMRIACP